VFNDAFSISRLYSVGYINEELGRILKEAAVATWRHYPDIFLEDLRQN
jgi:hypothetical protein